MPVCPGGVIPCSREAVYRMELLIGIGGESLARKKSIDNAYDPAEVAALYLSGLSEWAISRAVGLGQSSVHDVLVKLGVPRRPVGGRRRLSLNEDYFESVDTPEKAYWLGFIAADGGITPGATGLHFRLQIGDVGHLEKFRLAISSGASIVPDPTGATLRVFSKKLTRDLAQYGIINRKSYNCVPWSGPADLMPHYWRGVVDGDGHISKTRAYMSLTGTREMIEGFLRFAQPISGTRTVPGQQPGNAAWFVHLTGAVKVPPVVRALYELDGPSLDRKLLAAQALIARYPVAEPIICGICGERAVARELCKKHWQRWRKYGDPEVIATTSRRLCVTCGSVSVARGLCLKHYREAMRRGDPPPRTQAIWALT